MQIHALFIVATALMLAACATTPEQKAQREAERIRAEQALQVQLAAQCDPETAKLMHEQFNPPAERSEAEQQKFRLRYVDKVAEPMFQACYKMAWQNYISQRRLERLEYYYDRRDLYEHMYRPYGPFGWWW